ncbi:MAG: uroporphyrinogen decarboxylase family protein [Kiritimatiellia bacterium]|nr:uroporphyrinogen decarboxylase family protein [Kiritimatiellia bacterium]
MNERERCLKTLLFEKPDRITFYPGGGRESTIANWLKTGLPPDEVNRYNEYAYRQAGGKLPWPASGPSFPFNFRMIPQFEEKIIEEKENSRIVQDWKGNICEIDKKYGVEYLNTKGDFVTRRWLKCPVENRKDWEDMKRRYKADDPARLPKNAAMLKQQLSNRDWFVEPVIYGPFWQLREWVGFEGLCMLFYDDPGLTADMIAFWQDYVAGVLKQIFKYYIPDSIHISEDMAYKNFSMISPDMARKFILPTWKRWGEIIRGAGVPLYAVDSDGYIGELIPLWIEAGVNVCDPIEVAAGNDIAVFRRRFGKNMAYRAGVDKRAMAKGGRIIEQEIERLRPVIEDGGYIPSCDHGVPPDISWPDYVHYVRCLAKATGWL